MFGEKIKKLVWWDISLIKLASAAGILFIITVWPAAMSLVQRIHWGWFLVAMLVFMIKPMYKLLI